MQVSTCSCKKCEEDEIHCPGEPYQTKNPLKCDFHWLSYRIKCERRAEEAASVIHPEMGRGHSNLCEANFTVLPQFRWISQSLCRYECIVSSFQNSIGQFFCSFSLLKNNVQTVHNLYVFHYFAIHFVLAFTGTYHTFSLESHKPSNTLSACQYVTTESGLKVKCCWQYMWLYLFPTSVLIASADNTIMV